MKRLLLAFRAFFRALLDGGVAEPLQRLLAEGTVSRPAPAEETVKKRAVQPTVEKPLRSEAVTLLAMLQREARFVDFFKESLDGYSDAQIGAAARDVHRDCAAVLERTFGIVPLLHDEEQATVEVPAGYDPGKFKLVGNVTGQPPFHGRLAHHGWSVARCELAAWSGSPEAARVVAPAEIELT